MKDLELEDRIEKMQESECYITVKDHEEDFPHNISYRLINPSKSDIGNLCKIILDKINSDVLPSLKINQGKNSQEVIEWFKNIRNKNNASLIVFDVESFYSSISLELFHKVTNFVKLSVASLKKIFQSLCNLDELCYSIIRNGRLDFTQ